MGSTKGHTNRASYVRELNLADKDVWDPAKDTPIEHPMLATILDYWMQKLKMGWISNKQEIF